MYLLICKEKDEDFFDEPSALLYEYQNKLSQLTEEELIVFSNIIKVHEEANFQAAMDKIIRLPPS